MVDKAKIQEIVSETMANNADIQGMIVCDAKGDVIFGHTLSDAVDHESVSKLVVKISANSSSLTAGIDKGGLRRGRYYPRATRLPKTRRRYRRALFQLRDFGDIMDKGRL